MSPAPPRENGKGPDFRPSDLDPRELQVPRVPVDREREVGPKLKLDPRVLRLHASADVRDAGSHRLHLPDVAASAQPAVPGFPVAFCLARYQPPEGGGVRDGEGDLPVGDTSPVTAPVDALLHLVLNRSDRTCLLEVDRDQATVGRVRVLDAERRQAEMLGEARGDDEDERDYGDDERPTPVAGAALGAGPRPVSVSGGGIRAFFVPSSSPSRPRSL